MLRNQEVAGSDPAPDTYLRSLVPNTLKIVVIVYYFYDYLMPDLNGEVEKAKEHLRQLAKNREISKVNKIYILDFVK